MNFCTADIDGILGVRLHLKLFRMNITLCHRLLAPFMKGMERQRIYLGFRSKFRVIYFNFATANPQAAKPRRI